MFDEINFITAGYGGELNWDFTQVLCNVQGDIKRGVCHAASLQWILYRSRTMSLKEHVGGYMEGGLRGHLVPINKAFIQLLVYQQAKFNDFTEYQKFSDWLSRHGGKRKGSGTGKINLDDLSATFNHINDQYVIFGALNSKDDTGHAVAMHFDGATIWFFDPNFGEYKFTGKQGFVSFISELFSFVYEDHDYDVYHFCHIIM